MLVFPKLLRKQSLGKKGQSEMGNVDLKEVEENEDQKETLGFN